MRWSLRLGHIRGVPIEVHWLFGALVGWAAFQGWGQATALYPGAPTPTNVFLALLAWLMRSRSLERFQILWPDTLAEISVGVRGALVAVGLLVLIFLCVLIHEIAHTVHAQALGIPVRRIILLPIGGLAQLSRMPEHPRDELRVALVGPAANVALALIFGAFAGLWLADAPSSTSMLIMLREALQTSTPTLFGLTLYLAISNLGLAMFNLLPAFPMDGGRILRSLLMMVLPRLTATRVVTWSGWLIGGGFVLLGLGGLRAADFSGTLGLVMVGLFTLAGAGVEENMERHRLALRQIRAGQAVRQPTWTLTPTDALTPTLITSAFTLGRTILPVVVGARLVGIVRMKDLRPPVAPPPATPPLVAHVMKTQFAYVRADEDLWHAQELLMGADANALPVVDGDSLHGMLTVADIYAARRGAFTLSPAEAPIFIAGGNLNV